MSVITSFTYPNEFSVVLTILSNLLIDIKDSIIRKLRYKESPMYITKYKSRKNFLSKKKPL